MGSSNERRRYTVTSSLIGWDHTQNNILCACAQPMRDVVAMQCRLSLGERLHRMIHVMKWPQAINSYLENHRIEFHDLSRGPILYIAYFAILHNSHIYIYIYIYLHMFKVWTNRCHFHTYIAFFLAFNLKLTNGSYAFLSKCASQLYGILRVHHMWAFTNKSITFWAMLINQPKDKISVRQSSEIFTNIPYVSHIVFCLCHCVLSSHCSDAITDAMASQITSLAIVYSNF